MASGGVWMCPACWKTNRPQDTRCYRCHTARNADQATIERQRSAGSAPLGKDDARGVLDVFVALPAVVFSWYGRLMVLSAILLLVLAALFGVSVRGGLGALVLLALAAGAFLLAMALRWASQEMRKSNPRGFLVGLLLSLVLSGGELLGLQNLPSGTGNPVWEAIAIISIFGVTALLAAVGFLFANGGA